MSAKIINLTSHNIDILSGNKPPYEKKASYPPSGFVARACEGNLEQVDLGLGFPVVDASITGIKDLPDEEPGVFYIVSRGVAYASAYTNRRDLLVPSGIVRSGDGSYPHGRIEGCIGLCRLKGAVR